MCPSTGRVRTSSGLSTRTRRARDAGAAATERAGRKTGFPHAVAGRDRGATGAHHRQADERQRGDVGETARRGTPSASRLHHPVGAAHQPTWPRGEPRAIAWRGRCVRACALTSSALRIPGTREGPCWPTPCRPRGEAASLPRPAPGGSCGGPGAGVVVAWCHRTDRSAGSLAWPGERPWPDDTVGNTPQSRRGLPGTGGALSARPPTTDRSPRAPPLWC